MQRLNKPGRYANREVKLQYIYMMESTAIKFCTFIKKKITWINAQL